MPSAGARSHRPRRRGIRRCEEGARPRPDRYWRSRDRPRAGIARGRDPLREGTDAIRPRHRGVPDDPVEARTSSDRARRRAAPGAPRRGARRRRTSVHRCRLQGQALREPGGNTRRGRVAAGPGRIWIPAGFPRRAAPARRAPHGDRRGHKRGAADRDRSRSASRLLMAATSTDDLIARARSGDKRSIARLLSAVENDEPSAPAVLKALYPKTEQVDVVSVADTVCLVTVPGLGDDIQAIKAGVLEIADVLVVNKADRPGADETVRDLAQMLSLAKDPSWKPPIVRTAARSGEGIEQLVDAIAKHRAWAEESGERTRRRREAARSEVLTLLREALLRRLEGRIGDARLDAAVSRVADRRLDPYAAVDELLRD